ncbi:hypothetical protein CDAR_301631, partial [Caerostris darwini]
HTTVPKKYGGLVLLGCYIGYNATLEIRSLDTMLHWKSSCPLL